MLKRRLSLFTKAKLRPCNTSSPDCRRNQCCVNNIRPIGRRKRSTDYIGTCRPMGKRGSGILDIYNIYNFLMEYLVNIPTYSIQIIFFSLFFYLSNLDSNPCEDAYSIMYFLISILNLLSSIHNIFLRIF